MLTKTRTKRQRYETTKSGRIDWTDIRNILCVRLAEYGLHCQLIAKLVGLTRTQVYYRHWKVGVTVRNYRNGKTIPARKIVQEYSIKTITPKRIEELKRQVVTPINL